MNQFILAQLFPPRSYPINEAEAIRQIKLKQRLDMSLISWGTSFVADQSGGTRHEILSMHDLQQVIAILKVREAQI